jgi:hypothetical protein
VDVESWVVQQNKWETDIKDKVAGEQSLSTL